MLWLIWKEFLNSLSFLWQTKEESSKKLNHHLNRHI
jgi:hypothetical protein